MGIIMYTKQNDKIGTLPLRKKNIQDYKILTITSTPPYATANIYQHISHIFRTISHFHIFHLPTIFYNQQCHIHHTIPSLTMPYNTLHITAETCFIRIRKIGLYRVRYKRLFLPHRVLKLGISFGDFE